MTRAAGNHCPTARKRTGAPVEFPCVAGDHADVRDIDAERIGNQLREYSEVSLTLRAHAGRTAHFAARLDGHARAFVWPDARAFHVTTDADANEPSVFARLRLLVAYERVVADDVGCLLQRGQIVAAVVNQRRGILEHDLVIHRETVRRNQVALANLHAIDAELARRDVEQPLADEDAVLPPGAANRRDDRLVGEDGGELAFVVRNVVRADAACTGC